MQANAIADLAETQLENDKSDEAALGFHRSKVYLRILQSRLPSDNSRRTG